MTVEASIVIQFGESVAAGDAFLVAELDDERNVAADGSVKSQFGPGDEVYFLIHHDRSLVVDAITCTAGQVVSEGRVVRSRTERQTFTGYKDGVQLEYIPAGQVVPVWYGNQAVGYRWSGRQVTADGGFPCVGDVTYDVSFQAYRFIPPALDLAAKDEFPVMIVIHAEAA